jgi:hypothetical protein
MRQQRRRGLYGKVAIEEGEASPIPGAEGPKPARPRRPRRLSFNGSSNSPALITHRAASVYDPGSDDRDDPDDRIIE